MDVQISSKKNGRKIRLPFNFSPGKNAVLCGRGSKCTKSPGNRRLRQLVSSFLKPYSEASNKVEKTSIVTAIIGAVKQESPDGAFVKFEDGAWWEVEDAFAREKIGCLFRDCLHTQYRSSTKAKLARKKASADNSNISDDIDVTSVKTEPKNTDSRDDLDPVRRQSIAQPFIGTPAFGRNDHENINLSLSMEDVFGLDFSANPVNTFTGVRSQINLEQEPHTQISALSIPMEQHSAVSTGMGVFRSKKDDYKTMSGNFMGGMSGMSGRPHRQDFIRDCMPASNDFMGSTDIFKTQQQQPVLQADVPVQSQRQSQTSSLLRAACNIVVDPNDGVMGGCSNLSDMDDFPDDLSDIFEDDEDTSKNQGQNLDQRFFAT